MCFNKIELSELKVELAVQDQLKKLYRQFSPHRTPKPLNQLIMKENQIVSIYCLNPKKGIGVAILGYHTVIPGKKGWIENVVVDYES